MKPSKSVRSALVLRSRLSRRELLLHAARSAGLLGVHVLGATSVVSLACSSDSGDGADWIGPLQDPDANGLRLPEGFTSRVVAQTGSPVGSTGHVWHAAPDGAAVFATTDDGWIYVSNSEVDGVGGGVGAIRFAADGSIVDAYSILTGTNRNCAGGATPWDSWLSCEEVPFGGVYECDPFSPASEGIRRPALGAFKHEAAAVDPMHEQIYLTEDEPDGLLYRFTPTAYPSLDAGVLEAAEILDPGGQGPIAPGDRRPLAWHVVSDPRAVDQATRLQAPAATSLDGGEGCSFANGFVYFSTKGDNRVWKIDTRSDQIEILYDLATSETPILRGVDNVLATEDGDVYVAEDGGDLQIVALTATGLVVALLQVTGQSGTEITGPALNPDGTRLYFSSQRNPGITYEVMGPF